MRVDTLKFTEVNASECKVAGIGRRIGYVIVGTLRNGLTYKYIRTDIDTGQPVIYQDRDAAYCAALNYIDEEIDLIEWELAAYTGESNG